jgi:hypothetical protein
VSRDGMKHAGSRGGITMRSAVHSTLGSAKNSATPIKWPAPCDKIGVCAPAITLVAYEIRLFAANCRLRQPPERGWVLVEWD